MAEKGEGRIGRKREGRRKDLSDINFTYSEVKESQGSLIFQNCLI